MNDDNIAYFNSYGIKHIPKEIKKITGNKNITTNICRIQANDSTIRCATKNVSGQGKFC